mmetsp:Transcript_19779/g.34902  ORF Transcript_19779/g.34902 Transcript_19779/m.34902 type:complete len:441 (+) Transcript_19779:81-1403(+)
MKYPVFGEDEINVGMRDDSDAPFEVEVNRNRGKSATTAKKNKKYNYDSRMAKRTSKILSNYRAFLQEHDMEIAKGGSSDPPEDGFRNLHYHVHKTKNLTSSNHGGDGATCLLRDFSMPDVQLGSSDDGPEDRNYKLPPTVLRSKRVKYGVIMSFGLLLVIVVVIGATARGSNKVKMPTRENTRGWHSEAAYILEHEGGDMVGKLPHHDVIVPMKEPLPEPEPMSMHDIPTSQLLEPIVENDVSEQTEVKAALTETEVELEIESASTKTEPKPEIKPTPTETEKEPDIKSALTEAKTRSENAAATSSVAAFDLGKILHDKFRPLWLGSGEGWTGGSHDEAMQYCKNIRGKELCPYSAMCPYGPGSNVLAGRRPVDFSSQGEQYAPVYGHANRWVMVGRKNGDVHTTCMSHEQLEMKPPSWGLNGDRAEVKSHIMCCTVPKE